MVSSGIQSVQSYVVVADALEYQTGFDLNTKFLLLNMKQPISDPCTPAFLPHAGG